MFIAGVYISLSFSLCVCVCVVIYDLSSLLFRIISGWTIKGQGRQSYYMCPCALYIAKWNIAGRFSIW